ncbi:MAG: hypothetical protein AAF420_04075, partial [Pseudomonadota bacterium]
MNKAILGVVFALGFVLLESLQFVYFGGLFQRMDSFLFGFLVFGVIVVVFVAWTTLAAPDQLRAALRLPTQLIAVNVGAVITFTAYLTSVQL